MKKIILSVVGCTSVMIAMESPVPANRYFLRDLMQTYKDRKPLDLVSKSKATIADIKNWIAYARNNEKARAEFAREFSSTPQEIEFVLDILDAEILNAASSNSVQLATQPVVAKPAVPPVSKPALRPLPTPPVKPAAPKTNTPSINEYLIHQLDRAHAIKQKQENVIQVKTIDQFKLGNNIGPATCPVQALRNVITLLKFSYVGVPSILDLLADSSDARNFLELVGKCGVGTQWLTMEEIGRVLGKLENVSDKYRQEISALDTVQEINLYPDKLKALQEQFKQQNASHGFILGTMDVGQATGERGHYFAFVMKKTGPEYLYLIADTAPDRNHLDSNSYDYKRIKYLADMITKGKSDIDIDAEINKIVDVRYQGMMARALTRGASFDFKSLTKSELEGFARVLVEVERNTKEWKDRTRFDDAQLAKATAVVKQNVQDRLKQFKKP